MVSKLQDKITKYKDDEFFVGQILSTYKSEWKGWLISLIYIRLLILHGSTFLNSLECHTDHLIKILISYALGSL